MSSRSHPHSDGVWSSTPALEARDRQLSLWKQVTAARYVGIVALTLIALAPVDGGPYPAIALLLGVVGLAYIVVLDLVLRRRGVLLPVMAFGDQVFAVAVLALAPDLLTPVMLVMIAVNATNAVAFGRRIAAQAGAIGALGLAGIAAATVESPELKLVVYVGVSAFVIFVVGGMSDSERDLRWRYAELMGGIDAVVWEQLTRRPSTLYVNRRTEEVLGYPASEWRTPGFWRAHVHPDDVDDAAFAYRDAIRRGRNAELEYRMIAADGRIVHMHDRMRVETDELGRVLHVRGVMLDVTGERQARHQADLFIDLVDSIRHALFVFGLTELDDDASLTVLAVNPEAEVVAGVRAAQAIDRPATEVLPFADVDHLVGHLADVVRRQESWTLDEFQATRTNPHPASTRPWPSPCRARLSASRSRTSPNGRSPPRCCAAKPCTTASPACPTAPC